MGDLGVLGGNWGFGVDGLVAPFPGINAVPAPDSVGIAKPDSAETAEFEEDALLPGCLLPATVIMLGLCMAVFTLSSSRTAKRGRPGR